MKYLNSKYLTYKTIALPITLAATIVLAACTPTPPSASTPSASTPAAPTSPATTAPTTPESAPESTEAPAADDPLAGTQWVLESLGAAGEPTAAVGETPVTLEFAADGQVGGNAGCNSFGGVYQAEGDALAFGEIVSTLMACVDTAQMDQEILYLEALQTATSFQIDGDRLQITYGDGQGTLTLVRATASPSAPEAPATETPAPEAAAPDSAATDSPVTSPVMGTSQDFLWTCYTCFGSEVWSFANGQASRLELPVQVNYFFGYSPLTNHVLYSTPLPLAGGGPSEISVGDLWLLDVATGHAEAVISDQTVVEAQLAPNGTHIAYVLATDTTYELRWRGPNGEDTLLASDVAFTFSISPNSDKVAFTRESNYGLPGQPGLFVVDVASGEETMISDADRAGAGSIDDLPVWSPSGEYVFLPTYGTTGGPGLVRAAIDGSGDSALAFDPALAGEEWYEVEPFAPFWVTETQFIAQSGLRGQHDQMGGESQLILYQLNNTLDTIISGTLIGEGMIIGWDVPGASLWVQSVGEMQSIPLPSPAL